MLYVVFKTHLFFLGSSSQVSNYAPRTATAICPDGIFWRAPAVPSSSARPPNNTPPEIAWELLFLCYRLTAPAACSLLLPPLATRKENTSDFYYFKTDQKTQWLDEDYFAPFSLASTTCGGYKLLVPETFMSVFLSAPQCGPNSQYFLHPLLVLHPTLAFAVFIVPIKKQLGSQTLVVSSSPYR